MLYGSHRCSAKKLLVNCCNYILEHYEDITDPSKCSRCNNNNYYYTCLVVKVMQCNSVTVYLCIVQPANSSYILYSSVFY